MTLEDVGGRRDVLGCVARSSDQCAIPHNAHPAARVSDISLNYGDYINNPHHPWDERYIYLHEWLIFVMVNVGIYTSPVDPMGNDYLGLCVQ